jgi:hypothetical protein
MPAKAYSTKGLKMWIGAPDTPTDLVPTAIDKAKPAKVTVTNTAADGDMVYMTGTGFAELDGKWFPIGSPTATEFDLVGSDTTASTGTLAATPAAQLYTQADAFDLSCISKTITFNSDAPAAIAAGTYCDPALAITSPIIPPTTIELGGNINVADPAYGQLLVAQQDGASRPFDIELPFAQGDIVYPGVVSLVTWDLPVDGVQGFTCTITCGTAPAHRF